MEFPLSFKFFILYLLNFLCFYRQPGNFSRCSDQHTGWTINGSNIGRCARVCLSRNVQTRSEVRPASYLKGTCRILKVTTHLRLLPRERINAAIPVLSHALSWRRQRKIKFYF
jgi:hypothetical protein